MPELIFAASSHRFANYFIFAPVHMVIRMVVFLVPRTMHRTMAANLFSGNKKKYPAGRLLISMILLSLLTNFAASLTVAVIIETDYLGLACDLDLHKKMRAGSLSLCKISQILFYQTDSESSLQLFKLAATKFIISFPDHLVCFSSAVIVVAYILNARRYKMSHPYSKTIITNHPIVGAVYFFMLLLLIYVYTSHIYQRAGMLSAFIMWTLYNSFIVVIALMILSRRFNVWWFESGSKGRKKYIFKNINPNLKDAYEDSMKFAILYSVSLYFIVDWSGLESTVKSSELLKDKLLGALGVVVVISLLRYFVLIFARVGRYLRQCYRDERSALG
ncbi:MAG: hypothetical protein HRT83_03970 [Hyphomicrobiaceae bacterium]|nr:hypothetical protein [Hyphomicrobiaceae bacterium]